jgi:hypothetical protein
MSSRIAWTTLYLTLYEKAVFIDFVFIEQFVCSG